MPTYEYVCRACGHEFEEFQSIKADPITICPKCRKKKVERKIGVGGAVIFKGGGFYETDYRSDSYRTGEDAEKKATEAKAKANSDGISDGNSDGNFDGNSDGKSGSKSDSKAAGATDASARPDGRPDGKPAAGSAAHGADKSAAKSEGVIPSKPDGNTDAKSDASPASKSEGGARPDAAAATENKRIESRATHQSRIGRGIGNIVGGAKKHASAKKSDPAKKRGRGK